MISSVAYAEEEMLSEAKIDRPGSTPSRSRASSYSEIGAPNSIARARAAARPACVRGAEAAALATSDRSPAYLKYGS